MDFKHTLNLPDPDFTIPMKADLARREPELQAHWREIDVYRLTQCERTDAPVFVLHDGPPYTNAPIHLGTALNKILKDFVLKSRMVMGYRVPYVPGYDNHGLPIEQTVTKELAEQGVTPTLLELRAACRQHAQKYIDLQTKQFQRLGVLGLWEAPYRTMDYRFEAEIVRVFKRLVEKGYVYRGLRPTLWSPSARTALADTEIVYQTVTSKAIYVAFPLKEGSTRPASWSGFEELSAVIWTTTPWTIPANLALAFHPEHKYAVVRVGGKHFLLLDQLVETVAQAVGWTSWEKVATFKGSEAEGAVFKHPFYERDSVAVLADYVTTEDGTGIVHTAPGHGREDFYTGQAYGLPVLCPVDEKGHMTSEAPGFEGLFYKKCDDAVVERLREAGALLALADYVHSYPHAERDGKPVIFRATEQWFVSIDHDGLREKMLEAIDHKVEWFPRSGHTRIRSMIAHRPDWCVSRQRPWGVGIPVFYGTQSGEPVLDPVAIEAVAKLVEESGSDAWYSREPSDILPPGYRHPETGETEFRKETDVFDVWFDSGSTSLCVLEGNVDPRWKERWPADVYLEGSDQHRGWFNLSLVLGMAIRGAAPYRQVVTHGFVSDEQGQKMSKRAGNVLDPDEVCAKYGADILRYWAASVDYEDDAPCSDHLLGVASEGYRRVRNTLRFLLANLADWKERPVTLEGVDRWIVERAECLVERTLTDFEQHRYNFALTGIHNFCVNELSAFYLDAIKDRMYCDGADWPSRQAAQKACHQVLLMLTRLIVPILPHTAEEVYQRTPGAKLATVFLERQEKSECVIDSPLHRDVDCLLNVRSWVFAEFEEWKERSGVRNTQDVELTLTLPDPEHGPMLGFSDDLAILFKMAGVHLAAGERSLDFRESEWLLCERSKVRRADVTPVQTDAGLANLCGRCRRVLGL